MSNNKTRIAVLFPGALGDFICLLPALQLLGADAQIDIFAKTEFGDIVSRNLQVHSLERHEISRLFVAGGASEPRVRDFFSPYERIYSWMASSQPVFAAEMAAMAHGRAQLFPFRDADAATHQMNYYLSCLGFTSDQYRSVTIPLRSDALRWREEFWNRYALNKKPVLILAPGSGAREKNWPVKYFAAVAGWWREHARGEVVVIIGPVEEERGGFGSLTNECILARNLSLAQVAAILCCGDAYIGNDSGITHLAALLGISTVAVFGPSDALRWAPNGPDVAVLSRNLACSPCNREVMKRCPHRGCLTALLPRNVIEQLENFNSVANLTRARSGTTVLFGGPAKSMGEIAGQGRMRVQH